MAHPLARALRAANMSQNELSRRSGVQQSTINKVIRKTRGYSRFSPESAFAIVKVLPDVKLEDLLR